MIELDMGIRPVKNHRKELRLANSFQTQVLARIARRALVRVGHFP